MDKYDFSGWATKNDIKCADGRTIRDGAFKENDGQTVPLVWMHQHNTPENVLGHALLEYRPGEGMYAYGKFNDTPSAQHMKTALKNGDINSMSIYANQLKQQGGDVMHGNIRELSLVLASANPGAVIENVFLAHSDEDYEDEESVILFNVPFSSDDIHHADEEKKEAPKMAEEQKSSGKTVGDIYNSFTDEQKKVVQLIVAQALAADDEDNDSGEEEEMKHNAFDNDTNSTALTHADYQMIFSDAKRLGSLKEAVEAHQENGVLAHAVYNSDGSEQTYGVADINTLFPEYRNLNTTPDWIKRDTDWVATVMNGVHHTPFSRIKSSYANITMDEARAKGYIKGHKKKEEVFTLLRRTTDPQTIYKKQKLDRDDIIDITDFDVVAWIKGEMRLMLDEEIARAILVSDGRLGSDEDKISTMHIRPVWGDDDLFTIPVPVTAGADDAATAKAMIRAIIKARKDYKGSGNLTMFVSEDWLTEMLLLEDEIGHPLYPDEASLARKLRVNKIVTSPIMENQVRDGNVKLAALILDLKDYNVGADKGGAINMFDDFDIDYNQQKYLIETRISGALIKPFSAMAVEIGGSKPTYTEVEEPTGDENPSVEGWYEKIGDLYRPSADVTVNTHKTYYTKA